MKTIGKILVLLALVSGCVLLLSACKKDMHVGTMRVKMTDAPSAYSQVNVEILAVEAHYSDEKMGASGWVKLPVKASVYDLMALQNNVTAVLAENTEMPLGHITQLRLILGDNNSVVISNQANGYFIYPMDVPSSANTGIKINIDGRIESNKNLVVVLDFDAAASVKVTGNDTYHMDPVIKVKSVTWD